MATSLYIKTRTARHKEIICRLCKLEIFVSTVNRRHPIDMQSGLPFIHWLKSNKTKKLLDADDIKSLANNLPCNPAWELGHVRYAGIKSYFFLMIKKESTI